MALAGGIRQAAHREPDVLRIQFDPEVLAAMLQGDDADRGRAIEGIKDGASDRTSGQDAGLDQFLGHDGKVTARKRLGGD